MSLQRFLLGEVKKVNTNIFYWVFPLTAGFTWFIWDALDEEWLVSLKLAPDPEALNKRVESERLARLEALKKPKPTMLKGPTVKEAPVEVADEPEEEEEEEEEAPAEDKEDAPSEEKEEEEEAPADEDSDDVPAGEDGDDAAEGEEEEEEEEEESEVVIKPLYDPIKGKKIGKKDIWDNFTIRALNMGEDDDDDDEEEEEGIYIFLVFRRYSLLDTKSSHFFMTRHCIYLEDE
jgi:flagellar biosynthesis GTPase FlhF